MDRRKASRVGGRTSPAFDAQAFLDSSGVSKAIVEYRRGDTIFTQGDACEDVLYIQPGGVKLSVLSKTGREAVVAMLGPGDFFGEGCLAGQAVRGGLAGRSERAGWKGMHGLDAGSHGAAYAVMTPPIGQSLRGTCGES